MGNVRAALDRCDHRHFGGGEQQRLSVDESGFHRPVHLHGVGGGKHVGPGPKLQLGAQPLASGQVQPHRELRVRRLEFVGNLLERRAKRGRGEHRYGRRFRLAPSASHGKQRYDENGLAQDSNGRNHSENCKVDLLIYQE